MKRERREREKGERERETRQEGGCWQVAATPDPRPATHFSHCRRRGERVTTVTFVMALSHRLGVPAR